MTSWLVYFILMGNFLLVEHLIIGVIGQQSIIYMAVRIFLFVYLQMNNAEASKRIYDKFICPTLTIYGEFIEGTFQFVETTFTFVQNR